MKHHYSNLKIWIRSRLLVKKVYLLIENLPSDEKYGLSSQIKRSAVSIPSNIAEGSGRGTDKQFSLFLDYSIGSSCELETQLLLLQDLDLIDKISLAPVINELVEIRKMIIGFQKGLNR